MKNLLLTLPLGVAMLLGCRSAGTASDVYMIRLAMENLQEYERDVTETLTTEMRNLRASQEQSLGDFEARLEALEEAVQDLEETVRRANLQSGATGGPVRRQLVLPPDPESAAARPTDAAAGAPSVQRPPAYNPYAAQPHRN